MHAPITSRPLVPRHFALARTHVRLGWFFCAFLAVALVVRWPAIVQPWWHQDDYLVRLQSLRSQEDIRYYLRMGRPGTLAYHAIAKPAYSDARWAIAARLFGNALLAICAAAIAGAFTARGASAAGAWMASLYVVVWPFGSEVVVWLDAIPVILACALSILGALAVIEGGRRGIASGMVAIVAAVLTHPAGAMGGAALALTLVAGETLVGDRRSAFLRLVLVGAAYAVGLIAAFAIARAWAGAFGLGPRGAPTPSVASSLDYLLVLQRGVLFSYASAPRWAIWALLILPTLALILSPVRAGRLGFRRTAGSLVLLLLAGAVAFAPSLVTAERWPSARVAFAGTIVFAGWLCTAQLAGRETRWVLPWATCMLAAYLAFSAVLARHDASDYVRLYERDRETLARVESVARTLELNEVYVSRTRPFSWNPYGLRFNLSSLDHQRSEFLIDWQTGWLLRASSSLRPGRRVSAQTDCEARAALERPREGFGIDPLPAHAGICIIPAG